jgi:hypothetical protein
MTPAPTKPISHCTVLSVIHAFSEVPVRQNGDDYTGKEHAKAVITAKEFAVQTIDEIATMANLSN